MSDAYNWAESYSRRQQWAYGEVLERIHKYRSQLESVEVGNIFFNPWKPVVVLTEFPSGGARGAATDFAHAVRVTSITKRHEGNPPTTTYLVSHEGIEFEFHDSVLSAPGCRIEYVTEEVPAVPAHTKIIAKVVCEEADAEVSQE